MIKNEILKYDYIIFDLDNTIYDEFLYIENLFSSFFTSLSISRQITQTEFSRALVHIYKKYNNDKLIQRIYEHLNIFDEINFDNDLKILKTSIVDTNLQVFRWFDEIITQSIDTHRWYIVTNGRFEQQKWKIRKLGLNRIFKSKNIIYANLSLPKPSTECLSGCPEILQNPENTLMIGDGKVDENFALNIKCNFLKVIFTRNVSGYCNEKTLIYKKKF